MSPSPDDGPAPAASSGGGGQPVGEAAGLLAHAANVLNEHAIACASSGQLPPLDLSASGFAQLLFERASDALYVLDLQSQRYLAVNPAFCALTGYSQKELLSGEVRASDLLAPSDSTGRRQPYRRRAEALGLSDLDEPPGVGERLYIVAVRSRHLGTRLCEVSIQHAHWHGRPVTLGCARDITAPLTRQIALTETARLHRAQVLEERERTRHSVEANVRIMQITERIMRTPRFTKLLEHCQSREEVLAEACDFLASTQGMEFAKAGIYLLDDSRTHLDCRAASPPQAYPARVPLAESLALAQVVRGEQPYQAVFDAESVAMPLHVHGTAEGVAVVTFHPGTQRVVAPDDEVRRTLLEVLVTLTDLIGHRLETLDLIEKLRRQAIVDDLTGVYNRRFFDERLQRELERARRYGRDIALIVMDIDHFKVVNDSLGHPQGDRLLKQFARLLEQHTRNSDVVCRLGGDEFAIVLPETGLDQAAHLAEKLRREVAGTAFVNVAAAGEPLRVTVSVGVASGERGAAESSALYHRADVALYASKDAGRNCVTKG